MINGLCEERVTDSSRATATARRRVHWMCENEKTREGNKTLSICVLSEKNDHEAFYCAVKLESEVGVGARYLVPGRIRQGS